MEGKKILLTEIELPQLIDKIREVVREELLNSSTEKKVGGVDLAKEITGYSTATIYKKVREGNIPHYKIENKLFFKREELLDWISSNRKSTLKESEESHSKYFD